MQKIKMKMGIWVLSILFLVGFLSVGTKAYAEDEITIGIMGPMKFVMGQQGWTAAELAAEKINAAGGIKVKGKNYKIVLYKSDDNDLVSVPDAVSAMERLVTVQKVKFVLGGFRTEAVLAQMEIMADNKVIFIGTGSAHDEQNLRVGRNYDRYKYWFRTQPSATRDQRLQYITQALPAIRALNKIGIKKPKVALLIDKAAWAEPMTEGAKQIFPQLGCEVVGTWRPGFNASSFTAELSAIKSAGAHLIYNIVAGTPGNVISRQWGELQIPTALVGVNNEAIRETHWKTSDGKCNYLQSAVGIANVDITPTTKTFIADFIKKCGEPPVSSASYGNYDSLFILKAAIERANSLDPDLIVPELEKTDYVGVVGRTVFSPRDSVQPHDVVWGPDKWVVYAVQWQNGKLHVVWPDGQEIHPALIAAGAPKGWDKKKLKGTVDYVLPPWVIEYWKDKK